MKAILISFLTINLFLVGLTASVQAQTIEPAPGQSLTLTEDINFNAGKTLRVADTVLLKTSNSFKGNLFLGLQAGLATTGKENTFIGARAGRATTTGLANTFIGFGAGAANTTGNFNTFVGVQAGMNNTTGASNFMLGTNAGSTNTVGGGNFFFGDNAGINNTTGSFNVFLGLNSGGANTTGNNNTLIGFEANVGSGDLVNATAIGFRAVVNQSNSIVLGERANVGVGTPSPANRLHVQGGLAGTAGIRVGLTSASSTSVNVSKFLTVDSNGDVILAGYAGGGRQGVEGVDGLWQRRGGYLQSRQNESVIIGSGVGKTPAGYRLFVQDGILTEKVKVAIKNTSEWSDYVFAPNYRLKPLSEVSTYVRAHGHLPGVPSAVEVVEQGIDVGRMDAKLLEKIEELTLYSIGLERTNQQQQAELAKQQQELQAIKRKQAQLELLFRQVLKSQADPK